MRLLRLPYNTLGIIRNRKRVTYIECAHQCMEYDLLNMIPHCLLFCNRQKQQKVEPSRFQQWRHFSFTIDLFLLQAKLLQALSKGNITLLFVSYLFPKAKRSQRTFKWALQSFMVLRIKTPGTNEKHVSAGCRPHALASQICSAFQHFFIIWSVAFVTAGCFAFICHSLWWNTANPVNELYLSQVVVKCVQQWVALKDAGVKL